MCRISSKRTFVLPIHRPEDFSDILSVAVHFSPDIVAVMRLSIRDKGEGEEQEEDRQAGLHVLVLGENCSTTC